MSFFDLTGKTAIVTGAGRGLGAAIAVGLARAGADIALVTNSTPPDRRREGNSGAWPQNGIDSSRCLRSKPAAGHY